MPLVERGIVHGDHIVFERPLSLPEGTNVVVHIEPIVHQEGRELPGEDFAAAFGMWADRTDMADGADWERKERKKWCQRLSHRECNT